MMAAVHDTSVASDTPVAARRRTHQLVALAVVALVVFAALYTVAVRTAWGQRLDAATLERQVRVDRPRVQDATKTVLATINVGSIALVGGAIVLIAFARGRGHLAVAAALVIGVSDVTAEVLKRVILTRPLLIPPDGTSDVASFPSGHTAVAASLALAAVMVAPRRARGVVAVAGGAYALAIGEGVLITGWHRPSDVLGSYLLVIMWVSLASAWLVRRHGGDTAVMPDEPSRRALISPVVAILGAIALGVAFVGTAVVAIAIRFDRLDAIDVDTAYFASASAIFGLLVVGMATYVFVLRGLVLDPLDIPVGPARRP